MSGKGRGPRGRINTDLAPRTSALAPAVFLAPLGPWFDRVRRALPWRAEDLDAPHADPYAVLVSELMLQQTQVATVVPYFERWMARFPTAKALADAPEDEVHKAWEGLGYYRRARHLQAAASRVAESGWPQDLEGLLALPGLGPYTAAAVASQAFQWPEPALDGNAFRVLARLLALEGDPKAQAASLRTWLRPALVAHGPSRLTQALMELGATVCTPTPRCAGCPLEGSCAARRHGLQALIPPPAKRTAVKDRPLILVAVEAQGAWLLQAPQSRGLLAGLWQWPTWEPAESPAEPSLTVTTWEGWTQVYTHRRERVRPAALHLEAPFEARTGFTWVPEARLQELPMGRRDGRLRALLDSPGTPADLPGLGAFLATLRAPDGAPSA